MRVLRRDAAAAGLSPDFVIYDDDDQVAAVRDALRALDLSEKLHPPRRILSRISARKNSGRDLDEADGDSFAASVFTRVAERYRQTLESAGAVDFDDLLLRTVRLFEENASVRDAYRRRFPYVLVDEYQDTNRAQYELVRHLVGSEGNLTVVGDEDQSIYSWRGADIDNILDFEHDFPGARVFRLEENYRSSQAHPRRGLRPRRAQREPQGQDPPGGEGPGGRGAPPRGLGRVRGSGLGGGAHRRPPPRGPRGRALPDERAEPALRGRRCSRLRIPYVVVGGVGFYERREVKDLLAYLRLLQNPRDPVAFRRVLNVPPRGIGAKAAGGDRGPRRAEERLTPWEALGHLLDAATLPARAHAPLQRFRELIDGLRQEAPGLGVKRLLERVLEATGLLGRAGPGGLPGEPGPPGEPGRAPLRGRRTTRRARRRPP